MNGESVKIVDRSTEAAVDNTQEVGRLQGLPCFVLVKATESKSRFVGATAKVLIKVSLDHPRPEAPLFQPRATHTRLVLPLGRTRERQTGLLVLRLHPVKVIKDNLKFPGITV